MSIGSADDSLADDSWDEQHFFETYQEAVACAKEQAADEYPLNAVVFELTPVLKAYRGKITTRRIVADEDSP